jgi:hypothetical protein
MNAKSKLLEKTLMKVSKSMFIPASNRIIHKAIMLISGEALINGSGSYNLNTGPIIKPKSKSQITSGILVLT